MAPKGHAQDPTTAMAGLAYCIQDGHGITNSLGWLLLL